MSTWHCTVIRSIISIVTIHRHLISTHVNRLLTICAITVTHMLSITRCIIWMHTGIRWTHWVLDTLHALLRRKMMMWWRRIIKSVRWTRRNWFLMKFIDSYKKNFSFYLRFNTHPLHRRTIIFRLRWRYWFKWRSITWWTHFWWWFVISLGWRVITTTGCAKGHKK